MQVIKWQYDTFRIGMDFQAWLVSKVAPWSWSSSPFTMVRFAPGHQAGRWVEGVHETSAAAEAPGGSISETATTADEHMSEKHRKMGQWSPERFIRWASTIGPHTGAFIETMLRSRRHPQQAFRSCLGILRLADSYGEERLEAGAGRAVALGTNSYRSVESILTGLRIQASLARHKHLPH